jgi:hypothetical protein
VSLRSPRQALFFARTVLWQGKAARLRTRWAREGLQVPPARGSLPAPSRTHQRLPRAHRGTAAAAERVP